MRKYENLDILASLAAALLDSYINNWRIKKKEYYYIEDFGKELDRISKEELGVTALLIFEEVIWPNDENWRERKNDDTYLQINLLAKDLIYFREFQREKQEELRDICVKLSKRAASHKLRFSV